MTQATFNHTYQLLNPAQKQAVDQIQGPVMVVAGPGSGKTQVLTARIANILLKTDTDPSAILALTFTDSAAKNMRDRLRQMIGETAYYVQISTFHAFCSQIIKFNPDHFQIERDSQPLTDLERYALFEQIIDDLKLKKLKPLNAPFFYLQDVIKAISDLKKENITPADFAQIVSAAEQDFTQNKPDLNKTEQRKQTKNLAKQQDLLEIFKEYETRLRQKQRFDFDDMISLVVQAFSKDELFLLSYQEKLHYFLVDEYQDTNAAQNKVVDLLASYWQKETGQPNIFVVGDPNQSIYRFQGASVENMLEFVDNYPQAQVINLDLGYRCPQQIYNQASCIIKKNQLINDKPQLKLDQALKSQADLAKKSHKQAPKSNIQVFPAPVQTLETIFVTQEIKKLIDQGSDPAQIAVLYRYNAHAQDIIQALEKWGVRYQIEGGDDILKAPLIEKLLTFFQVLLDLRNSQENEKLFEVMQYEWFKLDQLAVMKLGRIAGKLQQSILDVLDHDYQYLVEHKLEHLLSPQQFKTLAKFVNQLYLLSQQDLKQTFTHWFEIALKQTGLLSWVLDQDNKIELLNQLNSLYNQIKAMVAQDHQLKLAEFIKAIQVMQDHRLSINLEDLNITQDSVHLSTVHKAKGREWEYVFLLRCVDGTWGNNRRREMIPLPEGILQNTDLTKKERNEDERRIFYVALTRAKKQVIITYPQTIVQDNHSTETVASQFISELTDYQPIEAPALIKQAPEQLAQLLTPAAPKPDQRQIKSQEKEFFANLVKNFKLSVTGLNSYLRDPKDFVYNSLLRVPRAKPLPMSFGSAMHAALEKMYLPVLEKKNRLPLAKVLKIFETALANEVLTGQDFKRHLAHGQEVLRNYYEQTQALDPQILLVERFFGFGWSKTVLGDIVLTGRVDRVDWVDQAKQTVAVLDYKTGKPKTKGYIEGQTKSANLSEREQSLPDSIKGPYKRQLLFYKLLTQLDRTFKPSVSQGIFEFVEPYKKQTGQLKPRRFDLPDKDVADLKQLIKQVMTEIRQLEFLKML